MKREKFEIVLEILDAVRLNNNRVTHIMHAAFMDYQTVRKYLDLCILKGLIKENVHGRERLYFLTEKGREALQKLYSIARLLDSTIFQRVSEEVGE